MTNVETSLSRFAKYVIQQSRSNLTRSGHKDTQTLYDSLGYELDVSKKDNFSLEFMMADYGSFVDLGVKGKSSSQKAPNSPFKFGTGSGEKGGLTRAINGWVQRKRFQFKEKSGRFMSYENTAFVVARSIYQTGLRPTMFFSSPFEKAFAKLPEEIIEAYSLDIDDFMKFTKEKK